MSILDQLCVSAQHSMLEVMARVNENEQGIALVVDSERHLLDTITDGDLRRAVLAGQDLRQPISTLQSRRNGNSPITARMDTPKATLRAIMRRHSLRHIPLLDDSGCVAGLAAATDFLQSEASEQPGLAAVVMVGGEGKRLRPLTQDLPKPMLPVGDKPLLERTIARLREAGNTGPSLHPLNERACTAGAVLNSDIPTGTPSKVSRTTDANRIRRNILAPF